MLMVATDGVFDNLPDSMIIKEMVKVQGSTDLSLLQQAANSIAQQARKLAFDEDYMSPFARNARENGINAIGGYPFVKVNANILNINSRCFSFNYIS